MLGDTDFVAVMQKWAAGVAAAGATAIAWLARLLVSSYAKNQEETVRRHESEICEMRQRCDTLHDKSEKCEQDREDLRVQVGMLQTKLETLELRN